MIKLPEYVYKFALLLPQKSYVVGGYVRDCLINKHPNDIDICSGITVEKLKQLLDGSNFKIISSTNLQTAKICFESKNKKDYFEYACFRKDYYNSKNTHVPYKIKVVKSIKQDSSRRDFSINSIYYDIKNNKIVDPKRGLKNIQNGTIKTVLSPKKTLKYDGERLLRLIKLVAITGFCVDKKILKYTIKYKNNINNLTNNLKQKYFNYYKSLQPSVLKNISPLLQLLDINF